MELIKPVKPKYGTMPMLMRTFKMTKSAISQHLSGRTNNELSQRIRALAIKLGGKPYTVDYD